MKLRSWFVYTAILALVIPLTAAADMVGEGSFDRTLKVYWTGFTRRADGIRFHLASQRISWRGNSSRAHPRCGRVV